MDSITIDINLYHALIDLYLSAVNEVNAKGYDVSDDLHNDTMMVTIILNDPHGVKRG